MRHSGCSSQLVLWLWLYCSFCCFHDKNLFCVKASEDGDESGSGDFEDDDGFFEFDDEKYSNDANGWENHSMMPNKCIEVNNEDVVVFTMYGQNNKDCNKNKIGTYKATVSNFVKAHTRQAQINAEANGYGYDLDDDLMSYLDCTFYENDYGFQGYIKLSCNQNTGKALQVRVYNDESCSQKASQQTNLNFDLSALKVRYGTCKSCAMDNQYYNNNNDNGGRRLEDGDGGDDDGNNYYYFNNHKEDTPLCSAAWYYKSTCNRKCVRMANRDTSRGSSHGFSGFQKFLLFSFIVSAMVLSIAVYGLRRRMDTQDTVMENTVIKKTGLKKEWIPKLYLGVIVLILFCIMIKAVKMAFFLLLSFNLFLFAYWAFLKQRKDGQVDVAGVVLYGNGKNTDMDDPSTNYQQG